MSRIIWIIFLIGLLMGCAVAKPLTWEELYPGPQPDFEAVVRAHLQQSLLDPDSLKDFSIDLPCNEITLTANYPRFGLRKGQGVFECKYVWYNAKNRMGGYTGKRPHIYWIRNDEVVGGW